MKVNIKLKIASIYLLSAFLFAIKAQAQVHADLELKMVYPQNNQIIPFGDSVRIQMSIINHGPDDIIDDTLLIGSNIMFGSGFIGDIPAGDTVTAYGALQWMGEGATDNDTTDVCYYFRTPVSVSNNVVDSNASNDTACVSYVMLGDPNTGIATSQANNPMKLFPNPASDLVTIQLNAARYHKLQLSVTDIYGREVLFHDYSAKGNFNKNDLHFNVSGLQPGIYSIHLIADDQTFMNKLVVR